jgi:hypothetical protein
VAGYQRAPPWAVGTASAFSSRAMADQLAPAACADWMNSMTSVGAQPAELDTLRLLHRQRGVGALTDKPALRLKVEGSHALLSRRATAIGYQDNHWDAHPKFTTKSSAILGKFKIIKRYSMMRLNVRILALEMFPERNLLTLII